MNGSLLPLFSDMPQTGQAAPDAELFNSLA